jgi:hypothetical protein
MPPTCSPTAGSLLACKPAIPACARLRHSHRNGRLLSSSRAEIGIYVDADHRRDGLPGQIRLVPGGGDSARKETVRALAHPAPTGPSLSCGRRSSPPASFDPESNLRQLTRPTGAPSRTRTDTWRILSPLPLPIGLWGPASNVARRPSSPDQEPESAGRLRPCVKNSDSTLRSH